jgi:tryptophan-rich sensory protein
MGISLYFVWIKGFNKKENKNALYIFIVQLILNVFWSVLFFGFHSPLFSAIEIIFLWLAILLVIIKFHKISKNSAYLLIPYILWVSFAAILNYSILIIN